MKKDILFCAKHSMLINEFTSETMIEFLELKLSEDDILRLKQEQKHTMILEDENISISKSKSLEEHFFECEIKEARNDSIRDAFED